MTDAQRAALEAPLDETPADHAARWNLADLLEEAGDADCGPLRWLASRGKCPRRLAPAYWVWFRPTANPRSVFVLPAALYARMRPAVPTRPAGKRLAYRSRREAEAEACRAWHQAVAEGWDPND